MPLVCNVARWENYNIQILVDEDPLQLYPAPKDKDSHNRSIRYLQGRPGKTFSLKFERDMRIQHDQEESARFLIRLDGYTASDFVLLPAYQEYTLSIFQIPLSPKSPAIPVRPIFSPLLEAGSTITSHELGNRSRFGKIEIDIFRGTWKQNPPSNTTTLATNARSSNVPAPPRLISEKEVKGGSVDLQISYSPVEESSSRDVSVASSPITGVFTPFAGSKGQVHTLELRYCSRAMLQMLDVIQDSVEGRQLSASDIRMIKPAASGSAGTLKLEGQALNTARTYPKIKSEDDSDRKNLKQEDEGDEESGRKDGEDDLEVVVARPRTSHRPSGPVIDLTEDRPCP